MSLQLPFSIDVLNQLPLDNKYLNNGVPYTGTSQVNTLLVAGVRHVGLSVNINNAEYWYKDGITNGDLVEKTSGSGSGGGTITGATNGLSLYGGGKQIGLGGTITGSTELGTLDGTQDLRIGVPNPINYLGITAGSNIVFDVNGNTSSFGLGLNTANLTTYDTGVPTGQINLSLNEVTNFLTKDNYDSKFEATKGQATMFARRNGDIQGLQIRLNTFGANTGITVSSSFSRFRGMEYDQDYSENFGPRSIPDAEWVLDNQKTNYQSITAETLTLKSSRDVFAQADVISTTNDFFANNYGTSGDLLPDNDVTFAILDPSQTILTFGTNGGGFYIADFNTSITTAYASGTSNYSGDPLPNNITKAIWIGGDTLYYTTTDFAGFGRFNYTTLTNERFTPASGNYTGDTIQNFITTNLCLDENTGDDIYFVVVSHGLLRFTISTSTSYKYDVSQSNYDGDVLQQLTRDLVYSNGMIWITTATGGMFSFDPAFSYMTRFSTTSGNYSGDLFQSNAFSNIVELNGILYFSGNRFDTSAIENKRLVNGVTYSGDTLSNLTYVSSDGIHIYSMSNNGYGKFNTVTNFNVNADGVDGYINPIASSIFLFDDPDAILFDPSWVLLGKTSASNGVGIIASSPSPYELRFDEHGLRYTSDQAAYFADRSLVDKGFVAGQISTAVNPVQSQVNNIQDVLAPYQQSARPAPTPFGTLYSHAFSAATPSYIVSNTGHISITGGFLKLTGGVGNHSESAYISTFNIPAYSGDSQNCFEFWKIRTKFRFTSTVGGGTYGLGLSMQSTNGYSTITTTVRLAAESSQFYFYSLLNGSPSQQVNGSYSSLSSGNIYYFEAERVKNRLYGRIYNSSNTLLGEGHVDFNISISGNTYWSNNTGRPAIYNFAGDMDVYSIDVSSNHLKNVDVVTVGDSNMHGLYIYSNVNRARYVEQAANGLGLTFNNFAGVDQGTRDLAKYKNTIKFSNPKYVYLNPFSNDIANSTGFTTQYNSLVSYLKSNIPYVRIIHGTPIARNYNVDDAYTTIAPYTASGDTMVDGFQVTKASNSNALRFDFNSGDYIHQNEWGNNAMAERLMMALLTEESRTILYT